MSASSDIYQNTHIPMIILNDSIIYLTNNE